MLYYNYPKRFKPLPEGYRVYQLDSGHFMWVYGELKSPIHWDRFWIRRHAFLHFEGKVKFV